jgi:hypothetical protein
VKRVFFYQVISTPGEGMLKGIYPDFFNLNYHYSTKMYLTLAWFCYKNGVKNEIIERRIGHSENSGAFGRYHGGDQELIPFLQALYILLEMAIITNQNFICANLLNYVILLYKFKLFSEIERNHSWIIQDI